MRAAKLIVVLAVALMSLPGLAWAATPDSRRLEGRLPDDSPVVSLAQPRGTVLDALSAIAKQTGWSLVVTAPEIATTRPLTIQVSKRPAGEVLDLVLDAGSLRASFADGVLRVRSDDTAKSADSWRERRRERRGRHGSERVVFGQSLTIGADETVGARVASAWGIFLSVAVSAIVGFIFLFALTTHLPNLSALFPQSLDDPATYSQYYFGGGVAVIEILKYNLGQLGEVLSAGIAIAMAFCGLSSVASAGRMLFAFSRDDGLPGAGWLKKVSHKYRTPANSLIAIVVVSWLFTLLAFAVGASGGPGGGGIAIIIITAISTIFLYAAYGLVIYLGATTSVNAPEPKGTICDACRPVIGSRFLLVTSTSAVLRERPT